MNKRRRISTTDITRADFERLPEDGKAIIREFVTNYDKDMLLIAYQRTGNGAHLWRAYRLYRVVGIDVPEWLLDWIEHCADKLLESDSTSDVAKAVGYLHPKGGDSLGNRHATSQLDDQRVLMRRYVIECERIGADNPTAPRSKKEVRERLAKELGTTEGAIKQKIMRLTK